MSLWFVGHDGADLRPDRGIEDMTAPAAPSPGSILSLDASNIDGSWYVDMTRFARDTTWLNTPMTAYSTLGFGLFVVLILIGWWIARRRDATAMTAALAVPAAAVIAYLVNDSIKLIFAEHRPCYRFPHAFLLEKCPAIDDYSFPSNHTVVVFAMAAALLLVSRALGIWALIAAAVMGVSRVYVGAHYPHDVAVGAVVGLVVGYVSAVLLRRYATPLVAKLSTGPLRPLLTTTSSGRNSAEDHAGTVPDHIGRA
jgi:membrane-associated phospholipid phosphatase